MDVPYCLLLQLSMDSEMRPSTSWMHWSSVSPRWKRLRNCANARGPPSKHGQPHSFIISTSSRMRSECLRAARKPSMHRTCFVVV